MKDGKPRGESAHTRLTSPSFFFLCLIFFLFFRRLLSSQTEQEDDTCRFEKICSRCASDCDSDLLDGASVADSELIPICQATPEGSITRSRGARQRADIPSSTEGSTQSRTDEFPSWLCRRRGESKTKNADRRVYGKLPTTFFQSQAFRCVCAL